MPASDLFTITGGSYTDYTENIEIGSVSFQLLGKGNITFNQDVSSSFFTVIGGGGGGGGGHNIEPGGGGGAGSSGKVKFTINHSVNYSFEVGSGGAGGDGNNQGVNGDDSHILFSITDYILAKGGKYGNGNFTGGGGRGRRNINHSRS